MRWLERTSCGLSCRGVIIGKTLTNKHTNK
jgi:hypothetical protein